MLKWFLLSFFSYDLSKNNKEAKIIVSIDFYKKSKRVKVKESEIKINPWK